GSAQLRALKNSTESLKASDRRNTTVTIPKRVFFFKQKTAYEIGLGIPAEPLFRSKAASGGIQGDVLATDNNTVGMGDAGIKSAIQGSNVPNPDEAVPSFVSGAMAKAGKGLLEGTLQAGTSAVSDKLLDLVGLGG